MAIPAALKDDNDADVGHVCIYDWFDDAWSQGGEDIDGVVGGWSGRSVSMSEDGDTVVIGAAYNDGNGNAAGHVR